MDRLGPTDKQTPAEREITPSGEAYKPTYHAGPFGGCGAGRITA